MVSESDYTQLPNVPLSQPHYGVALTSDAIHRANIYGNDTPLWRDISFSELGVVGEARSIKTDASNCSSYYLETTRGTWYVTLNDDQYTARKLER